MLTFLLMFVHKICDFSRWPGRWGGVRLIPPTAKPGLRFLPLAGPLGWGAAHSTDSKTRMLSRSFFFSGSVRAP